MSEAAPEGGDNGGTTPTADEFKPITSQDDLNKVLNERLTRERAKFADYRDLKAKATRLDELESANATEAEKAQKRIAELETELGSVRSETTRLRVAAEYGITDADDIRLFLTGSDDETLTEQAKRLAARDADRKKNGNHVPTEGKHSPAAPDDERAAARALFGGD